MPSELAREKQGGRRHIFFRLMNGTRGLRTLLALRMPHRYLRDLKRLQILSSRSSRARASIVTLNACLDIYIRRPRMDERKLKMNFRLRNVLALNRPNLIGFLI